MKTSEKKEAINKSVLKMITDKEAVRSYIQGKTSIQVLTTKGIKFAKPL
ncbi:MAG: hypothetical protein V4546_02620 [Bacteroidota bacterium]